MNEPIRLVVNVGSGEEFTSNISYSLENYSVKPIVYYVYWEIETLRV